MTCNLAPKTADLLVTTVSFYVPVQCDRLDPLRALPVVLAGAEAYWRAAAGRAERAVRVVEAAQAVDAVPWAAAVRRVHEEAAGAVAPAAPGRPVGCVECSWAVDKDGSAARAGTVAAGSRVAVAFVPGIEWVAALQWMAPEAAARARPVGLAAAAGPSAVLEAA